MAAPLITLSSQSHGYTSPNTMTAGTQHTHSLSIINHHTHTHTHPEENRSGQGFKIQTCSLHCRPRTGSHPRPSPSRTAVP